MYYLLFSRGRVNGRRPSIYVDARLISVLHRVNFMVFVPQYLLLLGQLYTTHSIQGMLNDGACSLSV